MILKQYYLSCLAHASYLIADEDTGTAVVVDPQRDVEHYLHDAQTQGLQIRFVFLTHFHADFLAGHLELRERTGATICLGARAQADYPFTPFSDGESLTLGSVRCTILETPGHTPEAISLVVYDRQHDAQKPYAVLTGDTLFIGDVGRPDLMASVGHSAVELAGMLYDSLHHKLLALPDETLVYPAHGAGSLCGKNLSSETCSPLGVQRRMNYALQPMRKEAFIALVTANQPETPPYFAYDADLNRRQRPTLAQAMQRTLTPRTLEEVVQLRTAGAHVVDTRPPTVYAACHLTGSINIGLNGQYALWAGTVLDRHHPIVLIADPGGETEAIVRLGRIGFDHVVGYLQEGDRALLARPDLTSHTQRLTPWALAVALDADAPPFVLDVRTPDERQSKAVPGSVHIPLHRLRHHVHDLPHDRPVVVYCASGYCSSIAVSVLEHHGLTLLSDVDGGMAAWEAAGLATISAGTGSTGAPLASPDGIKECLGANDLC
jgi:glyoxylase-like metal-dependent hydrolase (beta-lactamase superfamily II)/rhodanese-related sulfurtransferase